jgi:hypothetical protein
MTLGSKQNLRKTIRLLLETQESKMLVSAPKSVIYHTKGYLKNHYLKHLCDYERTLALCLNKTLKKTRSKNHFQLLP